MDPCRQERYQEDRKCKTEKRQTDPPTKPCELAREESTTESVNSLHGTAAVGADAVSGPMVAPHSWYVKRTSAWEAGLADHVWTLEELVGLLDEKVQKTAA